MLDHERFQQTFDQLSALSMADKIKFLETLLYSFTLTGRGIWSDENPTDAEKADAFKWMNELVHRVWNLRFELQKEEDNKVGVTLVNQSYMSRIDKISS